MADTESTIARWTWWLAPLARWLTGPIFDKEMRVSSRRRRNYTLRFIYIGLFTFLVALMWIQRVTSATAPGQSSIYQISRMASVGQEIITAVLWFQFITAQMIAIVMLSTSISDEIYKRTLGTLMTTPIRSFQIVVGKLASKLLQIVLLLAISLPLLAIVRVFGGVPWNYLLCGLCVTLTSVIFLGSLSLFFSIFTRRAYAAIIETILAAGALFGLVPLIGVLLLASSRTPPPVWLQHLFLCANPYAMMFVASTSLALAMPRMLTLWPWHCAVMLGVSVMLLLAAMVFVRKAALRQAVGERMGRRRKAPESGPGCPEPLTIRRVVGPPVLWKERRIPLFGRRKVTGAIVLFIVFGLLLLTYGLCEKEHILKEPGTHVAYVIVFFSGGILFTTVLPATCITTERESQTWSLLLTTTVSTWGILGGKLAGALRRCAPAWCPLLAHVTLFALLGIIRPIGVVQLLLLVFWVLLFLTSTGLFFSLRLRHTTTAVIANMALAAGIWALLPLAAAILMEIGKARMDVLKIYMDMNPFVQAGVIINATARKAGVGVYDWMQGAMRSPLDATGWLILTLVVYVSAAFLLTVWAAARLRRNPL